jgi:HSP20 family protein
MSLLRFSNGLDALQALQRELDRAFENPSGGDFGISGRGLFPAVNVFWEKDGGCVLHIEVPGVSPESLTIESQGRTLTLSGKRETQSPQNASFHRRERAAGAFSRSVQLPDDLDLSAAQASYKHGVLTLRIPKKEAAKPRTITVQAA